MNFNVNLGGGMGGGMGGGFGGGFNNQGMGMNMGMSQEPQFQQISVGQGINNQEYQTIVQACKQAYMMQQTPMSNVAAKLIKQYLGYAWLVICSPSQNKDYEFSITSVEGGDFMTFTLNYTLFTVIKIDKF